MPVIVGAPRSGTTLLRMMLDAHPELCIPPETGFLPAAARLRPAAPTRRGPWRREEDADLRTRFLELVTGISVWQDFGLSRDAFREALERLRPFTAPEGVCAFYRLYAARMNKPRWGDKTPDYGLYAREVESVLPAARFIHLIRDGRDVALSVRGLWFAAGNDLETLARDWEQRIRTTRGHLLGRANYLEVRYEQLIRDPEPELRRICEFIELPFSGALLEYHRHSPQRLAEVQSVFREDGSLLISQEERHQNQRRVTTPPDPSRVSRWKRDMATEEQERFEAVAGTLLAELGYETAGRVGAVR